MVLMYLKLYKVKKKLKTIQAIELNTSRISLGSQRIKLQDLMEKLNKSDGDIASEIRTFVKAL